jgi:Flp pilus assembly protein protease CpaA
VYGALLGGLLALGFIAVRRMRTANDATTSMSGVMKTWIPYGVALGAGTLVALALELSGRIAGAGA